MVKRRWFAATGAALVLAVLVLAATGLKPGQANVDTLSKQGDARVGLAQLERAGIGSGALAPMEILAPVGQATHVAGTLARALIAVLTFLLLARAFRSLLLPLKAVLLNVISVGAAWGVITLVWHVGAAWGVITLVWQQGQGSGALWGIAATHSVDAWIPLMVFAFLFGLSMDYEVFILARMREEYNATGSTDTAVVRGIGRTGRLVTSAALILFLACASMASAPDTTVKVFATGLAAGIILDATVIRALLVPAVVSLFGRWNWWLPERPARLLRVEPSLPPRAAAEGARG